MSELRDQLMAGAALCRSPFTVAELTHLLPEPEWPRTTVDRALRDLVEAGELSMVRQYPARQYVIGRGDAAALADPAPDWGRQYPSGGELIGPTWQAMWVALADREWHDVRELTEVGEAARGAATATVRNQLFAAAKAGLIEPEARLDDETHRWRIWYRRTDPVK